MKSFLRFAALILLCTPLRGQTIQADDPGQSDDPVQSDVFLTDWGPSAETIQVDSLPPVPKPRLIPANASFFEKFLWDENGFMRKIGLASPLTLESRKSELSLRRTMLTAHLIGGIATLGFMGTAVWYGQHSLDHPSVRTYRSNHQTFVTATIISYSLTGLLAVLSPPPLIRRDEVSTITIHKTLAWIHFAGMVVTPIVGSMLRHGRTLDYGSLARFHQISAYVTTAAFASAMIVITL